MISAITVSCYTIDSCELLTIKENEVLHKEKGETIISPNFHFYKQRFMSNMCYQSVHVFDIRWSTVSIKLGFEIL